MTPIVFHAWLLKFNGLMLSLGRTKVALILNNALGHLITIVLQKLKVTILLFLLANTMARFQPMDIGTIASFNCHYCHLMICKQLKDFELDKPYSLDVYDVVLMITQMWDDMTKTTIANYRCHCNLTFL